MLFTTLEFPLFLIAALAAYYILPKRVQWLVLLCASMLFYMGLGRRRILVILCSAAVTWLAARVLTYFNKREKEMLAALTIPASAPDAPAKKPDKAQKDAVKNAVRAKKRWVLAGFLLCTLGLLAVFKFYGMAADALPSLPQLKLIMPVGISFYTLQIVGYVLDVYNKKYAGEKSLLKTVLFTTYFPQIIQGPINRFDALAPQLTTPHKFDYDSFVLGLLRMLWGYFKKLVIADRFAPMVATLFGASDSYAGFQIGFVVILYTIQLYADFSGGIDIALGASELFGITLPENFKRPFFSKSISEFWRRWHITLGAWLRDYVFYPVTLSRPLAKLGKFLNKHAGRWFAKWIPSYIALFILWFCSGVWHGEGAQFIAYGLYHGTLIMLGLTFEPVFDKLCARIHLNRATQSFCIFQVARTFALVCVGELIFRSGSVSQAVSMLKSLFGTWNPWVLFDGFLLTLGVDAADFWVGIIAIGVLLCVSLANRRISVREWVYSRELPVRWGLCLGAILVVVVFGVYGPGYDPVPFIYFNF